MDAIWAKFAEYGIVGVVIGVLFLILWKMLVWVMAFIREERAHHAAEREGWLAQLKILSEIMYKTCISIDEHDKRADERGRYVREEHKEMITILGRINGYKHNPA